MKYTEKDLYKGMKLRCVSTIEPHWWNVGKQYEVEKRTDGLLILKDETGYIWNKWVILYFLNGKSHCKMEIVEEEEQMQYTESDLKEGTKLRCTQDGGCNWWTKGRIYTVANGCILDNEGAENGSYDILYCMNDKDAKIKFEIVEYPTATITVDVEQRINDKIEALSVERQNIFDKMERMDRQEVKLRDKINKLKEAKKALEILKEFK